MTDLLLLQAEAAKGLNQPELTHKFYREALLSVPQNEEERNRQQELRIFLSEDALRKKVEEEDWRGIAILIREELATGRRELDEKTFELLVYAETREENWPGVLSTFALMEQKNPQRVRNVDALMQQAQAAERQDNSSLANQYYRTLIEVDATTLQEKSQQEEVRRFLARQTLQSHVENHNWSAVSDQIRRQVENGEMSLDEENFQLLMSAETQLKNWEGVLRAYSILERSIGQLRQPNQKVWLQWSIDAVVVLPRD